MLCFDICNNSRVELMLLISSTYWQTAIIGDVYAEIAEIDSVTVE